MKKKTKEKGKVDNQKAKDQGVVEEMEKEATEEKEVKEELSPLEEMEAKYNEVNNKYLRLYSEFDNFRKRTQKEKLELYKTAGEDIMLALLPVIDDFERAEKSTQESDNVKDIKEGINLVYQKLLSSMLQKGLKQMESSIGKPFDVELHEAITQIPAPEEDLKGKVIDEVEKGYKLNEKVIRFSKVVVGK